MKSKFMFFLLIAFLSAVNVFADPLVLPDLGVTPGEVIQAGVTEGGSVIGIGLAFAVGIMVVFFGFKMLKKVLRPA